MFWTRKKLELVTAISILLIVAFLVTSLTSYYASRESLRSEITLQELPLTSDNVYSEIQRDLLRPVFISSLMAHDTFLKDWVINDEVDIVPITKYLKEIQQKYHTFTAFFVSENSRNYYHADGLLKKVSPYEERDEWYFRVRNLKDDYEINVDPDLANKDEMTIFVNYRVLDYQGKYIGAIGVGLTISAVQELITDYQRKYNRTIYFLDHDGEIRLSGDDFESVAARLPHLEYSSLFKEALDSKSAQSISYENEGRMVHANIRYIDEFQWYLVVEQPEYEIIRQIFTTLLVNIGICIVVTLVVLTLVILTITSYQKNIETLRGIVPICSYCKQIRDDKGYWNRVETYVARHTEAQFSHSICPECMEKNFPEQYESLKAEERER